MLDYRSSSDDEESGPLIVASLSNLLETATLLRSAGAVAWDPR